MSSGSASTPRSSAACTSPVAFDTPSLRIRLARSFSILGNETQHDALAAGQRAPHLRMLPVRRLAARLALSRAILVERRIALAEHDQTHRLDKLVERRVLEHIAIDTCRQRLAHMHIARVDGQRDDPDLRRLPLDVRDRFDAASAGHRQVHQDQVRHQRRGEAARLDAVARLARDAVVLQRADHRAQPPAQQRLVFGDQHPVDLLHVDTSARRVHEPLRATIS